DCRVDRLAVQQAVLNTVAVVDELVSETPPVAEEIAVHFVVVPVDDPAQRAITFADTDVATGGAMDTNRRRHLQVPLSCVVAFQRRVREYARRTNLREVAAELAFQNAVLAPAEIHRVAKPEGIQIAPSRVFAVEANATLALNAAVHLVIHQRA